MFWPTADAVQPWNSKQQTCPHQVALTFPKARCTCLAQCNDFRKKQELNELNGEVQGSCSPVYHGLQF